ncbi:MAG: hypothetical protein ISS26_07390 [Candidatus Omnitrophica bacterium]|nr:hypothetical protein [Candidatus Omnitrophota bacterium]
MKGLFLLMRAGIFTALCIFLTCAPAAAVIDTYYEDFDDKADGASIDGVGNWEVKQGSVSDAITQASVTPGGSGKALGMLGSVTCVNVSCEKAFDEVTPTWIEFLVKPAMGNETQNVPTNTIAAVTFDPSGSIYASDGAAWLDTGKSYLTDEWYRVTLKVDFSNHLYDVYVGQAGNPDMIFSPVKENLAFIDSSINSISELKFGGVYNSSLTVDDTYVDDFIVHFIDKLQISTASHVITKGQVSGAITIQLQNALTQPQTAWEDVTLELLTSSTGGEFSMYKEAWAPISQVTIAENAQQVTVYYKDTKSGNPIITVTEYPDRGWDNAMQEQKVISDVAAFDMTVETPQVAGKDFDLTIVAKDDEGEINTTYSGEVELTAVYITPNSGTRQIAPFIASGFSEGILILNANYPDCGAIQITAVDRSDFLKTGTSGTITFMPDHIEVACGTAQIVGKSFSVGVTAYSAETDAKGNYKPALNYKGPVTLAAVAVSPASVSGGSITPASMDTDDFENGAGARNVKFGLWGTIKIKASDAGNPVINSTSAEISFRPDSLVIDILEPSAERSFFYVGEDIECVVKVTDADQESIANYLGGVSVLSTMGFSLPEAYEFVAADEGEHSFLMGSDIAGSYRVTANEVESGLSVESPSITVKKAYLEVVDTESPIGSTEISIRLVDEEGNLIDSENDLTVNVDLEEEITNSSAASGAILRGVTFKDGIARVLVANTEAEYVTVIPRSRYKFGIKKGTVKFGKISKKGIGVLMWREIKTKE